MGGETLIAKDLRHFFFTVEQNCCPAIPSDDILLARLTVSLSKSVLRSSTAAVFKRRV